MSGAPWAPNPRALPPELIKLVADLAAQGLSARQIGQRIGRTKSAVISLCARQQIKLISVTGPGRYTTWSESRKAAWEALKADPQRYELHCQRVASARHGNADVAVRNCKPDAWEKALAPHGRKPFANIDVATRIDDRVLSGPLPRREVETGNSSMAWAQ